MPVRRRADVHDIDAWIVYEFNEVLVGLDLAPARLLGGGKTSRNARREAIGETDEPRAIERQMIGTVRYAAEAYERARKLVGRRGRTPKDACRHDCERAQRGRATQK